MGIGIKPGIKPGVQQKSTSSTTAAVAKPKPHQAMANAMAKNLGGSVNADLPQIPANATAKELVGLLGDAWKTMLGNGSKPGLNQGEAVWLLKAAAHPAADQSVHNALATKLAEAPAQTTKVAESGFAAFIESLAPSASAAAKTKIASQGSLQSAASKKALSQKTNGAMSSGPGVGVPGNAFSSRLALMTGQKEVKGTKDAVADLVSVRKNGGVPTSIPLNALDKLPIEGMGGLALQLDGSKVAGQRVVVRKVNHPDHGPGLEFHFKLRTGEDIRGVEDSIAGGGGKKGPIVKDKMAFDGESFQIDKTGGYTVSAERYGSKAAQGHSLEDSGRFSVDMLDDKGPQALRGAVRLRVFGEGAELNGAMADAIAKAGLGAVFEDSSTKTQGLANQLRVLWQRDPKKAQELASRDVSTVPQSEINAALEATGIKADDAASLNSKEVFPGHFTTVNPKQIDDYKKLGVEYLFAGVGKMESVVAILGGDGLMSTLERYDRGLIVAGASSQADIATGGADYVFTRMVTKDAKGVSLKSPFAAGQFQIIIDPKVLGRTDWFAYAGDEYGTTSDMNKFTTRKYGQELTESLAKGSYGKYASGNEVMFQRGVSKNDFAGIATQTESNKQALIKALTEKGITEIGGKPLDEAIQVRQNMVD